MQGASDTPARMTCRACVHCYARAIDPTNLQTISHTAKRTKDLHLCAFEELGEVKRTKGLHLCALGDSGGVIRTKNLHLCAFEDLGEVKRTKDLHLCAYEEPGEGQKNERPTPVCFGRLWRGTKERRAYICVLLKSLERDKRTKGLHLCAFEGLSEGHKNEGPTFACF